MITTNWSLPAAPTGLRHTRTSLADDLRALGVRPGAVLLVQSACTNLGDVKTGADDDGVEGVLLAAIQDVIGPDDGTIVVLASTAENSTTSRAYQRLTAGMTPAEITGFQAAMKPFDPDDSPSTGVGRFVEHVRTRTGAVRSAHPQSSFAALGPLAETLMADHAPDCHLGPRSPVAKLLGEPSSAALMIGVGPGCCTAYHYAEYLVADPPLKEYRCVVLRDGARAWYEYEDVDLDDADFDELGRDLESEQPSLMRRGRLGDAQTRLLDLGGAVAFAQQWLGRHR